MTWQPTDCHAHSTHSDGSLSVAEVVAIGAALGVRVSVTDHISRDAPTSVDSVQAVERYLDDLDQFDVLRGETPIAEAGTDRDEIRERTQGVWDKFYSMKEIWQRSSCVPGIKGTSRSLEGASARSPSGSVFYGQSL